MSIIHDELNKLGIACGSLSILQAKDGVAVARIVVHEKSYVLKCFQKDEQKRELENYRLLASLGIPALLVISSTDFAFLMEDIDCKPICRLGIRDDM